MKTNLFLLALAVFFVTACGKQPVRVELPKQLVSVSAQTEVSEKSVSLSALDEAERIEIGADMYKCTICDE